MNADDFLRKRGATEIREMAARIAEPDDYYRGGAGFLGGGTLPGRILCFARRHAAELTGTQLGPDHHHRHVLIAALEGNGQVCIDAESFALGEGEVQLICPFQFHSYTRVRPGAICWIFVTFEWADAGEWLLRSRPSRPLGAVETLLLREMVGCWLCEDRRELLPHHLGLLLRRLCAMPSEALARNRAAAKPGLLARVNGYALPRLDRPLPLKQLAAALGESESHLRARFREATGGSLGRHLRRLRLQKACQLLRTTALNVTEIAGRCGFDSLYSFSRTFKAGCGVSPRAYRERAP